MRLRAGCLVAGLALIACGGGQAETTTPVEESSLLHLEQGATEAPAAEPGCPGDAITRADLKAVLDAGPAQLLALVETRPRHRSGRFAGFEIMAFTSGAPPSCPALELGDVVTRINGRVIERPEHYFEVFQALRTAGELKIEIIRAGEPITLKYAIED